MSNECHVWLKGQDADVVDEIAQAIRPGFGKTPRPSVVVRAAVRHYKSFIEKRTHAELTIVGRHVGTQEKKSDGRYKKVSPSSN
jgi:hypothetical protein